MPDTVTLMVDGDEVELNAFVRKALASVVTGFLSALHDVPPAPQKIVLSIGRGGGTDGAEGR